MDESEESIDSSATQEPFFNPTKGKLDFWFAKKLKFVSKLKVGQILAELWLTSVSVTLCNSFLVPNLHKNLNGEIL